MQKKTARDLKKPRVKRPVSRYAKFGLWFGVNAAAVAVLGCVIFLGFLAVAHWLGYASSTGELTAITLISAIIFVFALYFIANLTKRKQHTLARWTRKSLNVLVILTVVPLLITLSVIEERGSNNNSQTPAELPTWAKHSGGSDNNAANTLETSGQAGQQATNSNTSEVNQSSTDPWLENYLKQQEETNKWLAERDRCWDLKKVADKKYMDVVDEQWAIRDAVLAEWNTAYARMMQQNYPLYMIQGEERVFKKLAYSDTNAIIRPAYVAYVAEYNSINSQGCDVGTPLHSDYSWPGY